MTITKKSREFTKQEQYLMTKSPSILTVKSVPDLTELKVLGWLTFDDVDSKGKESEMLAVLGEQLDKESGELITVTWCCQSATFKRSFFDLVEIFGNEMFSIKKLSGITRSDKDYVNCDLAV